MTHFACPTCGATHAADHALAGTLMPCHACGLPVTVPMEFGEALPFVRKVPPPTDDGPLIGSAIKRPRVSPWKQPVQWWLAGAIILAGLWVFIGVVTSPPSRTASEPMLQSGDRLYVKNIGGKSAIVATSLDALNKLQRAALAEDTVGLGNLALTGEIIICRPGTELKLLDRGIEQHEVRIMSGEYFGASGWIDVDKVVR